MNVYVSEFDFLLIEAQLPRMMKKTKQKFSTGHLNITHFQVESKFAIHFVPKQGQTRILESIDLFL